MSIEAIEAMVIKRLANGPRHGKIFVHCKPVVARMVAQGKIERVNVGGGAAS